MNTDSTGALCEPLVELQQMMMWKVPNQFSPELYHIGCAQNIREVSSQMRALQGILRKRRTTGILLWCKYSRLHTGTRSRHERMPESCTQTQEVPPRRHVSGRFAESASIGTRDLSVAELQKTFPRNACFQSQPQKTRNSNGCGHRRYLPTRKTQSSWWWRDACLVLQTHLQSEAEDNL